MALQYSHRPLNGDWPGPRTRTAIRSPFGANWGDTLELLERELRALEAKDVVIAITAGTRDVRNDGGLRSDARIKDPAVILEFKRGPDRLSFPCDRFNWWQDNVRAIALALEALRKVDRYGVRSGKQYEGFKALPGAGATATTTTAESAAHTIAEHSLGFRVSSILESRDVARDAVRSAQARTHPDRPGGDDLRFQRVEAAKATLAAHHGGTL